MITFAVLVPTGPGTQELARLTDLFDSLSFHEPRLSCALLVDDYRQDRKLAEQLVAPSNCEVVSVPNPRRGKGHGWTGGLCAALLTGCAWFQKHRPDLDFIVKLDTDALVIAPFSEKIAARFHESSNLGMLGCHRLDPRGKPRPCLGWTRSLRTFLSPVSLRGRHLQITLWGGPWKVKQALRAALANGYRLAEHCQGGAYAFSRELLVRMAARGYLDDPLCWSRAGIGEDVMMGVYARAAGMELADYNAAGEPFGIQFQGLPYPPETLLARGYSIVHSVKDHGDWREEDTRQFFQSLRHDPTSTATAGHDLGSRL